MPEWLQLPPEEEERRRLKDEAWEAEQQVFTVAEVAKLVDAAAGDKWQRSIFSIRVADPQQEASRQRDWAGLIPVGF